MNMVFMTWDQWLMAAATGSLYAVAPLVGYKLVDRIMVKIVDVLTGELKKRGSIT